jgi:hypothetical protein
MIVPLLALRAMENYFKSFCPAKGGEKAGMMARKPQRRRGALIEIFVRAAKYFVTRQL